MKVCSTIHQQLRVPDLPPDVSFTDWASCPQQVPLAMMRPVASMAQSMMTVLPLCSWKTVNAYGNATGHHHQPHINCCTKYLCDVAAWLSDVVWCSCRRCLWLVRPEDHMQLTERPVICTLANTAVWVSAVQTDSQTLDTGMPTTIQHMYNHRFRFSVRICHCKLAWVLAIKTSNLEAVLLHCIQVLKNYTEQVWQRTDALKCT